MSGARPIDAFRGQHVVSVKQFKRENIEALFQLADEMKLTVEAKGGCDLLKHRVMTVLFYEPSTRTSSSFQAAMLRLGGSVIPITDVKSSSVSKGETLGDTVRSLESYSDFIVMRHPEKGAAAEAARHLKIPLINGGDGTGEHPTQALLDSYTIKAELGKLDGLTITMLGDLKNGRTVHSLARLLSHFKISINFVSPASLKVPQDVLDDLKAAGTSYSEHADLKSVLKTTDVLYVTRVQKERFATEEEYKSVSGAYVITPELLTQLEAKDSLRILHPLPRVDELSQSLDSDPRAAYFRQMRCGLFVRMALLAAVGGAV